MVMTAAHLAQAPIEVAVRAALAAQGRFDRDDIDRVMVNAMRLPPEILLAIAANPTGSAHLVQPAIISAAANIASPTRETRNIYGPAGDPARFGTGRIRGDGMGGLLHRAVAGGDGDDDGPVSGASYASLNKRWDGRANTLNADNWGSTDFAYIPGLNLAATHRLLAAGYSTTEILRAGSDVEALSRRFDQRHRAIITTADNIERATRLNRDAPEFMGHVTAYADTLSSIRTELASIAEARARLAQLEAGGRGAEAAALRESIETRQAEIDRRRREADEAIQGRIDALPETRKPDATGVVGSVREAHEAAAVRAEAEARVAAEARVREEAAAKEAQRVREEAAAKRASEEAAAKAAADRARVAALMGEDTPTKGPATVVQESAAKKEAAPVQEGAAKKDPAPEAPPIKLAVRSP